jgi:hypothetical protein
LPEHRLKARLSARFPDHAQTLPNIQAVVQNTVQVLANVTADE